MCADPKCPHNKQWPQPDPRCNCDKPLAISIPPGQHIHPCPVHPDVVIAGPTITC